jgi:hypothetical protein
MPPTSSVINPGAAFVGNQTAAPPVHQAWAPVASA